MSPVWLNEMIFQRYYNCTAFMTYLKMILAVSPSWKTEPRFPLSLRTLSFIYREQFPEGGLKSFSFHCSFLFLRQRQAQNEKIWNSEGQYQPQNGYISNSRKSNEDGKTGWLLLRFVQVISVFAITRLSGLVKLIGWVKWEGKLSDWDISNSLQQWCLRE